MLLGKYAGKFVKISAEKKLMFKKDLFVFVQIHRFLSTKTKCVSGINIFIGPQRTPEPCPLTPWESVDPSLKTPALSDYLRSLN